MTTGTIPIALALALALLTASGTRAAEPVRPDFPNLAPADWPGWRGPTRDGHAPADAPPPPTRWSDTENVLWKSPVPGRGHSSPIVVGRRVLLTTADDAKHVQSVLAYDRRTGAQLWRTDVHRDGFPPKINAKNTHASPTPASDGQRVFALFSNHKSVQLTALDLDGGKQAWQINVGDYDDKKYGHGFGASPVLYRDTVIVCAESAAGGFLVALDRATGKQVWRTPRPDGNSSYSTPSIAHVAGRDQLLLSGANLIAAYDPATGKPLWSTPGTTDVTVGTMASDGDVVIASGGFPKPGTFAVRADGTATPALLWKNPQQSYEPSLLAHQGHFYALTDNGTLFCWRAADGKEMWKHRLQGPVSASAVLANGHAYWPNARGTVYVFNPTPEKFDLVAENTLGEETLATPALSAGHLFLRTATKTDHGREETLYCIGAKP